MAEHTYTQFSTDLELVRSSFLRMGGVVETMINTAALALADGDLALVEKVRTHEKEVNQMEVEIDEHISHVLARHQPAAIDLRMLLAVSKMLTDMERCGDEAGKVASVTRRIYEGGSREMPLIELHHMASDVLDMLRQTLDAFARLDAVQAAEVVRRDKAVDREWKAALRHLITYMIEDPRTISRAIDMIFIARAIERIGDHAKNMAERVIYLVHGADVRHKGVKTAEREARGEPDEDELKIKSILSGQRPVKEDDSSEELPAPESK